MLFFSFNLFEIKTGIIDLLARLELLETNYIHKEDELCYQLSWFISDQTQLAKIYRRDVEELKRIQQEHMSKLDIKSNNLSFNELIQQQINKYYIAFFSSSCRLNSERKKIFLRRKHAEKRRKQVIERLS